MKGRMNRDSHNWRTAIDAALIMAIGMGFGRFAFTAIYPQMVEDGILDLHGGSLAASANYAGYLLGALLAVRIRAHNAHQLCLWSMIGTVLCLALPALVDSTAFIVAIRGIAGAFSALAMVAVSLWLLEHRKQIHRSPFLYAGVGVGIALSSELLVLGGKLGLHSKEQWLLLSITTLIIGIFTIPSLILKNKSTDTILEKTSHSELALAKQIPLVTVYGLAGFGYIITATYLPLLVKTALPNIDSAHVWAVFGLGAIPSCFLWHHLHQRFGTRIALTINLGFQAFGVVLPVIFPSTAGYLLSALLVGGTFMGTVTIAMPAAQRLAQQARSNLIAMMTVVYGCGQILGPITTNILFTITHSLSSSLIAASLALVSAAFICILTI